MTGEDPKKLLHYYHPNSKIDELTKKKWTLNGFDCSGLLFWATNGGTPRNTGNLITYGTGLSIAQKTKKEIQSLLQPLDLILWVGHVMIVIDDKHIIESRVDFGSGVHMPNGVRIRTIESALDEVLVNRIPVNNWKDTAPEGKKKFVIRRWFGIEY